MTPFVEFRARELAALLDYEIGIVDAQHTGDYQVAGTECTQMMTGLRRLRTLGGPLVGQEQASELVEMAFVLPILLTLLIGIFWIARAYNIYETIARAAREGARASVAPSCSTCGGTFLSSSAVQSAVASAMTASSLATSGPGISINVQQHQQLNLDANNPAALWTVVTVTYPFKFALPFTSLNWTTITMKTTAQMVEEQ